MSNGTPEPFEGGPQGPLGPLAVLSLLYSILWIVAAGAALIFDLSFLTSRTWLVTTSAVLLAVSLVILAKEMGLFEGRTKPKPR